jgi:ATP-binding cassette subfamily A (ABC1) protein 3
LHSFENYYLQDYFALLMIIALLYPLSNAIKTLVVEKETKLREGFMIMSLRSDILWAAWGINYFALFLPLSIILMLIGTLLFAYSDPIFVFLYFFMFFMASTSFCVLISVIFSKGKAASIIGTLVFFGGYFVYVGLASQTNLSRAKLMLACIHPATAFTYGTLAFREYEDNQIGVTSYTYDTSKLYAITFADTIVMQTVNFFYLLVLSWYLAEVWPSEYGTSKPWYFIIEPKFWRGIFMSVIGMFSREKVSRKRVGNQYAGVPTGGDVEMANRAGAHASYEDTSNGTIEPVTEDLRGQVAAGRCIQISNLVKSFDTATGVKIAVDGLDLTIYSGQITALLGHNGAGKRKKQ